MPVSRNEVQDPRQASQEPPSRRLTTQNFKIGNRRSNILILWRRFSTRTKQEERIQKALDTLGPHKKDHGTAHQLAKIIRVGRNTLRAYSGRQQLRVNYLTMNPTGICEIVNFSFTQENKRGKNSRVRRNVIRGVLEGTKRRESS